MCLQASIFNNSISECQHYVDVYAIGCHTVS